MADPVTSLTGRGAVCDDRYGFHFREVPDRVLVVIAAVYVLPWSLWLTLVAFVVASRVIRGVGALRHGLVFESLDKRPAARQTERRLAKVGLREAVDVGGFGRPVVRLMRRRCHGDGWQGLGLIAPFVVMGIATNGGHREAAVVIGVMLGVYLVLVALMLASMRWRAARRAEQDPTTAMRRRWSGAVARTGLAAVAAVLLVGVLAVRETHGPPLRPWVPAAFADLMIDGVIEREGHAEVPLVDGPVAAVEVPEPFTERRRRLELELRVMASAVMASDLGEVHRWLAAGPVEGPTLLPTDGASAARGEMQVEPPAAAATDPRSMSLVNLTLQWAVVQSTGTPGPGAAPHLGWFAGWLTGRPSGVAAATDGEGQRLRESLFTRQNTMALGLQGFRVAEPDIDWLSYFEAAELLARYISVDAGEPLARLADASGRTIAEGRVMLPLWRGHEVDPLLAEGVGVADLVAAEVWVLERVVWAMPDGESERGRRALATVQRWLVRLEQQELGAAERRRLVLLRRMVGG